MDDPLYRKRPRSASPIPTSQASKSNVRAVGVSSRDAIVKALEDPAQRNAALNGLLRATSSHDNNFTLQSDSLVNGLAQVFFDVVAWDNDLVPEEEEVSEFPAQSAWTGYVSNSAELWAEHCTHKMEKDRLSIDEIRCIEAVMVIYRNLSFVAGNLRLLAYSKTALQVIVGAMYASNSNSRIGCGDEINASTSSNSIALSALHALVNLAPYLDVTGQKLLCDKLFLKAVPSSDVPAIPEPSTFGQAVDGVWGFGSLWLAKRLDSKEDVVQDVSKELLLQITTDYLIQVWSIFPALATILADTTAPRLVIMMAVDLLQEFINHARVGVVGSADDYNSAVSSARSILVNIPHSALDRLTDLLCLPRLGSDGLDYVDPVHNIVTRVTTLKLLVGYDASVDTDVRDRALDVLVPLLELDSPRLARKLGIDANGKTRNRLFDSIVPILTTKVGRNEAPLLASQLLRELSKAEENKTGCLFLQERIVSLASTDPRVAHLAFNHMFPTT